MKKIALVFPILLIFAFIGCEKEENRNSKIVQSECNNPQYNFLNENFIQDILEKYEIDIVSLSNTTYINELAQITINSIKEGVEFDQASGEISDFQINQLQSLYSALQIAYNNDDELFFLTYESFCAICHQIDGFIFQESEYGFELFTYNQTQNPINIPTPFMEHMDLLASELSTHFIQQNGNFYKLDPTLQNNIIASAIYYKVLQSKETNPNDNEECLKEALRMYAASMTAAMAIYQAELIGCSASGPAIPACLALATASYGVSVAVASWQYNRAVKRC